MRLRPRGARSSGRLRICRRTACRSVLCARVTPKLATARASAAAPSSTFRNPTGAGALSHGRHGRVETSLAPACRGREAPVPAMEAQRLRDRPSPVAPIESAVPLVVPDASSDGLDGGSSPPLMAPSNSRRLRAALQIRAERPETAVLLLSQHVQRSYAEELSSRGRSGRLLAEAAGRRRRLLPRRCPPVAAGGRVLDPEAVATMMSGPRRDDRLERLSPRRREVLTLMAEGAATWRPPHSRR